MFHVAVRDNRNKLKDLFIRNNSCGRLASSKSHATTLYRINRPLERVPPYRGVQLKRVNCITLNKYIHRIGSEKW